MKFDEREMQRRFHELRKQRDAIREQSAPLRAQRDAIEAEARDKCAAIDDKIRVIEVSLSPVKTEMAIIARALNGKTGSPE